jgi:gustatory receptor
MKKTIQQISYIVPMILEIFLPCYFANEISIAAEKLSMGILHCKWYNETKKFNSGLRIFIVNATKPIIIMAGKLFEVNLKNFVNLCNITYKFYAVLKNMNVEE